MKKIVINGASSFIGRNLVNFFLNKKNKVYAIIRDKTKLRMFHPNKNLEIICLKNEEMNKLSKILNTNIDYFYDFSWIGSNDKRNDIDTQILNLKNIVSSFNEAQKLKAIAFIVSGSIYEDEFEWLLNFKRKQKIKINEKYYYGIFKNLCRNVCSIFENSNNTKLVWLKISNVYGPGEISKRFISTTIRNVLSNTKTNVLKEKFLYDFVYIDDAISLISEISKYKKPNSIYSICSGNPKNFQFYVSKLKKHFQLIENNNVSVFKTPKLKKEIFLKDFPKKWHKKIKYSFEEGIKKTYEWYKNTQSH